MIVTPVPSLRATIQRKVGVSITDRDVQTRPSKPAVLPSIDAKMGIRTYLNDMNSDVVKLAGQEHPTDKSILAKNRCIVRSVLTCMSEGDEDGSHDLFTGVEDVEGDWEAKDDRSRGLNLRPSDRPRGILSQADREYLCGLKDYSHNQTELNRKQSIRERTIEGLRDFDLLWLLLDKSEQEKIIDALDTEEIDTCFSSMVTFMYLGLDRDTDRMEDIIEEGIYHGVNYDGSGRWSGGANEVSVNIDIDRHPDVEELYTRFKEGEEDQLTSAEIGTLVQAGKLDAEDLQALENTKYRFPKTYSGSVLVESDED